MEMPTVKELLLEAQKETANIRQGEEFLVRDLFKGYEWNRIPIADRFRLGANFLDFAKTTTDIVPISKTTSKQQKYSRK